MTKWNKLTLKPHSHAPTIQRCRPPACSLALVISFNPFQCIAHCSMFKHTAHSHFKVSYQMHGDGKHAIRYFCCTLARERVWTREWVSICNQVTGVGVMLCVFMLCFMCDLMWCFASYVMLCISLHLDIASCLKEDALFWTRFAVVASSEARVGKCTRTSYTGHTCIVYTFSFIAVMKYEQWILLKQNG